MHPNASKLAGLTFGLLRAIEPTEQRKDNKVVWRCVCVCGGEKLATAHSLKAGLTRSCGCLRVGAAVSKLEGRRFGRLVALNYVSKSRWLCRCDCGTVKSISTCNLTRKTRSCGCLRDELNTTHGMSGTLIYKRWHAMLERCNNPARKHFEHYGGRGIKVCERWHVFENFFIDMGYPPENMSVDRIDVNRGYEPNNCRWATKRTQALNKRPASTVALTRLSIEDMENEIARRKKVAPLVAATSNGSQNVSNFERSEPL